MVETPLKAPAYNGELRPARGRVEDNTVGSLSEAQRSLIVGSLLGDGAMRCKSNALLEINHSSAQRAYVDWKYATLRELVRTPPKERPGNGSRRAYRFTTLSSPLLTPYYRVFYEAGRKIVPEVGLDPMKLAVWFMDDGSRSYRTVYLNSQQFSHSEQLRLLAMLKRDLNLEGYLNRDKAYFRIRLSVASARRLCEIVRPHMRPELSYKLPR